MVLMLITHWVEKFIFQLKVYLILQLIPVVPNLTFLVIPMAILLLKEVPALMVENFVAEK